MLQTWIYMVVDKAFFKENGVEYAVALGTNDIKLSSTYEDACHEIDVRSEVYRDLRYMLSGSGVGANDDSLAYWKRYEQEDGWAHVLEIHRKVVFGELFQVGRS